MLRLTVLFTVITALIQGGVHCKQSSSLDIENLLQSLQRQLQLEQSLINGQDSLTYDSEDEDVYGTLRSDEAEQLINLAKNDYDTSNKNQYRVYDADDNQQEAESKLLQQLNLLQSLKDKSQKVRKERNKKAPKRFVPNKLLNSNKNLLLDSLNNRDDDDDDDSDDNDNDLERNYSNIYLVLNPDAVEKSQNKDKLNDLLTKLLLPNQRVKDRPDNRYKGFMIKDNNVIYRRRRNRDDGEIYAKDSMESNYKMKRNRGGDRGGSGSGRTAIPYIRHRGDIYEKDN